MRISLTHLMLVWAIVAISIAWKLDRLRIDQLIEQRIRIVAETRQARYRLSQP